MTVYVDILFLVNSAINYLLLTLGARLTGYPGRWWRSVLGAVIGGGYAVVVLIPSLAFLAQPWGKIMSFLLMAMTAYGVRRKAARPSAAALLCGGALAGVVFLMSQVFSSGLVVFKGHIVYPLTSGFLLLMAGSFYLAAALLMSGSMKHGQKELSTLHLQLARREITVKALRDTGHTLTDPVSGKPVVILDWRRGSELMGVSVPRQYFQDPTAGLVRLQAACEKVRLRLIPYKTVGAPNGLLLGAPCRLKMNKGSAKDVIAAFSAVSLSDGGCYEALIGGDLI